MVSINTMITDNPVGMFLYNPPSKDLIDYLQNNYYDTLNNSLNGYSREFRDNIVSTFNSHLSDEAIGESKRLLARYGSYFGDNVIYDIKYEDLNKANYAMQRYIMANPSIGSLYKRNSLYGFQDTFYDREPGYYGEDRLDYCKAMDGILQFDSEGEGYIERFAYNDTYYNELDLTDDEQFYISNMYKLIEIALANGLDPTDPSDE